MCDCNLKKIVDLSHLKIYTVMAEYKAKLSSGSTYRGGVKINWATATQEELAYAYEDLGMTTLVEKLSTTKTKDEPAKTTKKKKSGKKSSDSKE
jgi:isocitrate lyase